MNGLSAKFDTPNLTFYVDDFNEENTGYFDVTHRFYDIVDGDTNSVMAFISHLFNCNESCLISVEEITLGVK